jgi:hypothetical protein
MLKITSDYFRYIKPILGSNDTGQYWVVGEGSGHSNYLYYMKPIAPNEEVVLCNGWQVGNITNAIKGSAVTYTITAHAVQIQGGAINELMAGDDGWQYAPQIFRDMVSVY